ncbi:MAG: DUF1493 family protein [Sphingobacteriales bacterium]|nr:MAG: DUF1493 family protein [Sphingobacteriales bacterium]
MEVSIHDIIDLVKEKTGDDDVNESTDIFEDLGCVGDDFHELIEEYAKKYNVDMTSYLWYFHADEEGGWNSIGGTFFKPPYERIKRIPVTPLMLLKFATKGKWEISYPEHHLPKRRYDIITNQIVLILFLIVVVYYLIKAI